MIDDYLDLGNLGRDTLTGISGVIIAKTFWHDRSNEVAIQREGLDAEAKPFDVHWFPSSRLEKVRP